MPGTASESQGSESVSHEKGHHVRNHDEDDKSAIAYVSVSKMEATESNGHNDIFSAEERPSKRRRVSEGVPSSLTRPKPESPPWKRVIAEGPSSFTQNGVRRSGRTNQLPLELQPSSSKRQTRGAVQKSYSTKGKLASASSRYSLPSNLVPDAIINGGNTSKRPLSSGRAESQALKSPAKLTASPKRLSKVSDSSPTPRRPYKKRGGARLGESHVPAHSVRRSARASEIMSSRAPNGVQSPEDMDNYDPGSTSKTPRIRLKVKQLTLPVIHPDMILRRPKRYPNFEDFVNQANDVAVEDGGLLAAEDDVRYTTEMAERDAHLLALMEEAAKGQGILSAGVSSAYKPDDFERDKDRRGPLRQYAHQDHLIRAVTEFRGLMLEEHRKHKRTAKRLAEACRDVWHKKQPKTEEEIEAEAAKVAEGQYKSVVKSMQATWENVKAEVNRRRIQEWEAEEQVRVRKALNEAVDISTQKLEARRLRPGSEILSDEEEEEYDSHSSSAELESENSSSDSDSNMSSSESDAEDDRPLPEHVDDEHLTVEELRQKYSNLPETRPISNLEKSTDPEVDDSSRMVQNPITEREVSSNDDSDESIDMDDDLGSSDEGYDSDDNDEGRNDDNSEGPDGVGETSLLDFLAPSDLDSLGITYTKSISEDMTDEDMVDEEDEVSLIPDATQTIPEVELARMDVKVSDEPDEVIPRETKESSPGMDVEATSADRSSQPTPRTTETKVSEIDSASSVELQPSSRQATNSITPQPASTIKTPVPFLLRGTLREYQHFGLDWLAGLYANNTNGILADEMGLGKTIQTIALLAHLACEHHVWGPHLVIVPTSVMLNWEMEFKKWCPGFKILTYYGTQEERKRKRMGWATEDTWNVVITSYQLVLQDQQVFKRRKWHYMILDEAHNIKNFRSQRWQTLLTFNTRARLLLTGTPLQNNLTELWSLLFFLMPSDGTEQGIGGFADLKEFSDWFKKPQEQILENGRETMDDEARAIISKLHKVLRPYLLRRMKADVEKQMPAKYEHVEYCRLSRRQRELYDGFLSRSDTRGTLASGNYLSIINCLMQLRKVCNHPDLFQERPIISSFPMKKSVLADYEIKDLLVRRRLLREHPMNTVSLEFLNLVPSRNEHLAGAIAERSSMLTAQRVLMDMREAQRVRAQYALSSMDPSTVRSNLVYLESASRWGRFEELQHCVYLNALRRQQRPLYGNQLVDFLDFDIKARPALPRPDRRDRLIDWMEDTSSILKEMIPTLDQRANMLHTTIQKFACITPPIVAPDTLSVVLTRRGLERFQTIPGRTLPDPFHEARMRLSVQFPDKRLLQYDCGKLQALDKLLRRLQSGGHRALIFTQMTKVLDILEQFLNIHGHRYLRLDGSTKIEQRQILTDRFNNDNRILAFILSSRSGGLGINLTGADTVIFYDLDWNPAMDKQCQDRCHRIGQTRDVHIYRLVSEHTIEANILRKANQKRMLDDVVIQEGEFTTDYFNKTPGVEEARTDVSLSDADAAAEAAMDRVLGGPVSGGDVTRVLAQAEDQEDVAAARVAQQEIVQTDAADFDEKTGNIPAAPSTSGAVTPLESSAAPVVDTSILVDEMALGEEEVDVLGRPVESIDDYMLKVMMHQLKDTPLDLPKDRNRSKRGKEHRNRSHRPR
ncbi:MAG: swr1 complex component [Claussenomyces sp. TS43310]|nr:MAG: swr1 complex component [Claussenomyces sp. TS43310]